MPANSPAAIGSRVSNTWLTGVLVTFGGSATELDRTAVNVVPETWRRTVRAIGPKSPLNVCRTRQRTITPSTGAVTCRPGRTVGVYVHVDGGGVTLQTVPAF